MFDILNWIITPVEVHTILSPFLHWVCLAIVYDCLFKFISIIATNCVDTKDNSYWSVDLYTFFSGKRQKSFLVSVHLKQQVSFTYLHTNIFWNIAVMKNHIKLEKWNKNGMKLDLKTSVLCCDTDFKTLTFLSRQKITIMEPGKIASWMGMKKSSFWER